MPDPNNLSTSEDLSTDTTVTTDSSAESKDPNQLLGALRKERSEREQASQREKASAKRAAELEAQLDTYKAIDPARYEALLESDRKRQEEDLSKKNNWEELKRRKDVEIETATKKAKTFQDRYNDVLLSTAFEKAFYAQGGMRPIISGELQSETAAPVDIALSYLKPRLRVNEDGSIEVMDTSGNVELNTEGKSKHLQEKLLELKMGNSGFLFEPERAAGGSGMNPRQAPGSSTQRVYSAESARKGKADLSAIAKGTARIRQ